MTRPSIFFAACALLLVSAPPAAAGEIGVGVQFTDGEIAIIQAYYRDGAAPGRTGNASKGKGDKRLPPGIAKNLQRGKPLPPGIAKQALPAALVSQLPPAPRGFERIEVAGKILLVEVATQVVHDVLEDFVLGP